MNGEKSLTREVLKIAWPMVISELGDSLYSITDTYFVSRLGTLALAAVGAGSYISWLFFVVVALFSTGILVFAAQSYGAKEIEKARRALGESIITGFLLALIIVVIVRYFSPLLVGLIVGANRELVDVTLLYFNTRIIGLPFLIIAVMMDSVVRAVGATKYSMIAVLSSAIINMILDPILIFGLFGIPAFGVAGAALATVISIIYMIPLEIVFLRKLSLLPLFSIGYSYVLKVLRIGAPAALERLIFSIGNNAYISFISRCGSVALAAHQVGIRIESFIYMPGFAFSVAAASLVGQRVGSGNIVEGKRIGLEAAKIAALIMTVLGVIVALIAHILVLPFAPNTDVASLARIYLILAGLSEPGLALAMTLSGAIRGGGNTLMPMILNAVGLYAFRVFPAAVLVGSLGVVGAWLAMFLDVYLRGTIFLIIYSKYFEKIASRVI